VTEEEEVVAVSWVLPSRVLTTAQSSIRLGLHETKEKKKEKSLLGGHRGSLYVIIVSGCPPSTYDRTMSVI